MRFLLTNCNDSLNKGTATIALGAIESLREVMPNSEFTLFSIHPELCAETFRDKNIRIVRIKRDWFRILRLFRKDEVLREYDSSDMVIDLAGDCFSDDYGVLSTVNCCLNIIICKFLKKPIVIYAQSIGPFKNLLTKRLAKFCLNKADLVMAREKITKDYLDGLGVKNVKLTAPLAFLVDPAPPERIDEIFLDEGISAEKPIVGISASQLLYVALSDAYTRLMVRITDYVTSTLGAHVILIPHALRVEGLDDRKVCEMIKAQAKDSRNVWLPERDYLPKEIKGIIGRCSLFIGARMHANIAALSMCVPTLAIAYSHKTHGIMAPLRMSGYVINSRTMTFEELKSKVDVAWAKRDEIREALKSAMPRARHDAELNAQLVREKFVALIGKHKKCYIGHSTDDHIRYISSSGGLVTQLLISAIETGLVDGALVTRMSKGDPLKPEPFIARSRDEIIEAAGSKYCPVSLDVAWRSLSGVDGRFAVVGLPCDMRRMREAEGADERLREKIALRFGLFCNNTPDFAATDFVLKKMGIRREDILSLAYRGGGLPVTMKVTLKDGSTRTIKNYWDTGFGQFFALERCRTCRDQTSELADISFGDAWLPGINDKIGTSIVVGRSDAGCELLRGAQDRGEIELKEVSAGDVVCSQGAALLWKKGTKKGWLKSIMDRIGRYLASKRWFRALSAYTSLLRRLK